MWVAVGEGTTCSIAYSYDGIDWNAVPSSTNIFTCGRGVAYNETMWVAVGEGSFSIATSSNGINWDPASGSNIFTTGRGVAYNGTRWVAVGQGNYSIAYSNNGRTDWLGVQDSSTNIFTLRGMSVAYNGTIWVAVGEGTINRIVYSSDGINWDPVSSSSINIFTIAGNGVAWNGSMWVAVGYGVNKIAYSYNGSDWFPTGSTILNILGYGVAYNGTMWVAVGYQTNTIAYSSNGTTWNAVPSSRSNIFSSYGYGVASGSFGENRVSVKSSIIPSNTNIFNLGSTTNYWRNAYITNISASNISVSETITLPANSITYDKLNSNITSLITNSNITRNLLAITSVGTSILIPVDLVNNDYVDVEATIRFSASFNGGNRLWSLFYNGSSYYNWKFWRLTNQPPYASPWITTDYLGMTMFDMENSNYWGASNVRIRIYRGEVATTIADTRLYTVEGEARYSRFGIGPEQNTFWGSIEYRPTHVYLYVPSGCTFSSRYYVTNYK
jgi:hypothetical protein